MYHYFAYGLGICSELALPELLAADAPADVTIRLEKTPVARDVAQDGLWTITPTSADVWYSNMGSCIVRGGSEIILNPAGGDDINLRLFVLGPAFAILLHQRGRLVLHGSAIEADGDGVAFLALSGGGKSTIAAAMHQRGYRLIADDLVAVSFDQLGAARIDPAPPFVKIWPDSASAIGKDITAQPRVHPPFEKRVQPLANGFVDSIVPFKQAYILAVGEHEQVEQIPAHDAFVELVRYTFVAPLLKPAHGFPLHFQQCTMVAATVPIFRLTRRLALDSLKSTVELVMEHLQRSRAAVTDRHDAS